MICPRCSDKSSVPINRKPAEKMVVKGGQTWAITFCIHCQFNFDLREVTHADLPVRPDGEKTLEEDAKRVKARRKTSWFKSELSSDPDDDRG